MRDHRLAALVLATCAGALPRPGAAIEPILETPGWRGFVIVGAGYTDLESNLVAGNSLVDIGRDTISSVDIGPQGDDAWHPVVTGEINYTFGNRSQVFLGTSLEDAVTLDAVVQLGLRRQLEGIGTLQAGFLFSGAPSRVWEDPYAEGVSRDETDRSSTGLRLEWERILGTAFDARVSWRGVEVDTERSGQGVQSVACDATCQDLLRRDGDNYSLDLSYLFRPGAGGRHLVRPMVRYTTEDRDGDAIAGDAYRLQLSYAFLGNGYMFTSNIALGERSYDDPNPIYDRKTDADRVAADATLFYRLRSGGGRWQLVGSLLWAEEDSDVDFHDNEVLNLNLGVMYRFGAGPAPEAGVDPDHEVTIY